MKNKGFTLIELLVVISIISLLSSVVAVSVQDARNKGNVAKVKADFVQIRNAAELYKTDTGNYPSTISSLVPTYLAKSPSNPFKATPIPPFSPNPPGGGGGGLIISSFFQKVFISVAEAQGWQFSGDSNGYSIALESDISFCGQTNSESGKEIGKFFVYSSNNVGVKNVAIFNSFKVEAVTSCFPGPPCPLLINKEEPKVYPCLE